MNGTGEVVLKPRASAVLGRGAGWMRSLSLRDYGGRPCVSTPVQPRSPSDVLDCSLIPTQCHSAVFF